MNLNFADTIITGPQMFLKYRHKTMILVSIIKVAQNKCQHEIILIIALEKR